jgi:hypothetical protein
LVNRYAVAGRHCFYGLGLAWAFKIWALETHTKMSASGCNTLGGVLAFLGLVFSY